MYCICMIKREKGFRHFRQCYLTILRGGERLNFIKRLFKPKETPPEMRVNIPINSGFSPFSGAAYDNAIFRGAVDTIAKHAAKLKPYTMPTIQRLDRVLQIEPNPYISAYDLLYKAATAYFCDNNAFILIHRDNNENVTALYNLTPASVEFLQSEESGGALYCKFTFKDGANVIIPYADIIHLRRHFAKNELLGTDNAALFPALETAHAQTEGIKAIIQNGVTIRGVLQFTNILNEKQLKEAKDKYVKEYLQMNNSGGVIAIDNKIEYTPITTSGTPTIDPAQLTAVQSQIYSYLNISAKMVSGEYSEDDFAAFYESVIEPFALQMSLEYTRKIFTPRERAFGREIIFGGERLEFASAKTRISLLRQLLPYGILTINESRKILSLPELPDGDKRLQSLNFVNAAKADEYQEIDENNENN